MSMDIKRGSIAATIKPPCIAVEATAGPTYTNGKASGNVSLCAVPERSGLVPQRILAAQEA